MAKNKKRKPVNENLSAYLFLAPWLIGFIFLIGYPIINTIYLSFFDAVINVDGLKTTFIGIQNYTEALFENTSFTPLIISFVLMELTYIPSILVISLIIAILLNSRIRFKGIFRVIYFFPVVIMSGPVMKQLESANTTGMFDVSKVLIFRMVESFSPLLGGAIVSLFSNFTIILWLTGIPVVLFLNGLQRINTNLYEAAQIDGANQWQILWKISLPILKPTALIVSIFVVIQIALFEMNPIYQYVVNDQITKNRLVRLGFASGIVVMYSFIIIVMILVILSIFREKSDDKYMETLKEKQAKSIKRLQRTQRKDETVKQFIDRMMNSMKRGIQSWRK